MESVQPTNDLVVLSKHFVNILKERSAADGTLKVHKDAAYTENPMEREDVEETVDVQITWTDGQDTLTALVTVELDGDSGWIPGFGASLAIMALIGAGIIISRRNE